MLLLLGYNEHICPQQQQQQQQHWQKTITTACDLVESSLLFLFCCLWQKGKCYCVTPKTKRKHRRPTDKLYRTDQTSAFLDVVYGLLQLFCLFLWIWWFVCFGRFGGINRDGNVKILITFKLKPTTSFIIYSIERLTGPKTNRRQTENLVFWKQIDGEISVM